MAASSKQLDLFAGENAVASSRLRGSRKSIGNGNPLDEVEIQRFWSCAVLNPFLPMRERLRASEALAKSKRMFVDSVDHVGEQKIIIEHRQEGIGA